MGAAAILAAVFLPGIALCYAIFPKKEELNLLERIGLSFVLGMTPTFLLYALDKNFSVAITTTTTLGTIVLTAVVGFIVYNIRKPAA